MIKFETHHSYKLFDTDFPNFWAKVTVTSIDTEEVRFLVNDASNISHINQEGLIEIKDLRNPRLIIEQISKHKQIKSPFLMGFKQ